LNSRRKKKKRKDSPSLKNTIKEDYFFELVIDNRGKRIRGKMKITGPTFIRKGGGEKEWEIDRPTLLPSFE